MTVLAQPVTFDELRERQVMANPEEHRYRVDNAWISGGAADVVPAIKRAFTELPTACAAPPRAAVAHERLHGPALDTTINATTNLLWLLAHHPDQWDLLRADPSLIPNAIDEALRMESPIHSFSRCTTETTDLGGVAIPAGSRVSISFAAANRDPRAFADPDRFDVARANASEHIALGHGRHACPGGHLAKLEIRALMRELVERVERFEVVDEHRRLNNSIRGLDRLVVRVVK